MANISEVAGRQLAAWQAYGDAWALRLEWRQTEPEHRLGPGVVQVHLACAGIPPDPYAVADARTMGCGMSIMVLYDGSASFSIRAGDLRAMLIAHLRNNHRDLEDKVYAKAARGY